MVWNERTDVDQLPSFSKRTLRLQPLYLKRRPLPAVQNNSFSSQLRFADFLTLRVFNPKLLNCFE